MHLFGFYYKKALKVLRMNQYMFFEGYFRHPVSINSSGFQDYFSKYWIELKEVLLYGTADFYDIYFNSIITLHYSMITHRTLI